MRASRLTAPSDCGGLFQDSNEARRTTKGRFGGSRFSQTRRLQPHELHAECTRTALHWGKPALHNSSIIAVTLGDRVLQATKS